MKKLFATLMSVAVLATFTPAGAQTSCPAEVTKAKEMLAAKGAVAKSQDVQAPRSLAGARGQDTQAPRSAGVGQAPRAQDAQAPERAVEPWPEFADLLLHVFQLFHFRFHGRPLRLQPRKLPLLHEKHPYDQQRHRPGRGSAPGQFL